MNTLRDTDKRRARPVVGLVRGMSALIGVISAGLAAMMAAGVWLRWVLVQNVGAAPVAWRDMTWPAFVILAGLFGVCAAVGAYRLRPWGWWAVVVWAALYFIVAVPDLAGLSRGEISHWAVLEVSSLIIVALTLIASRQLFFPPKPEGEEQP